MVVGMVAVLQLLLQVVLVLVVALVAGAIVLVAWHRWKYPRGQERIIAFFHPHCAAGGGGERVLWAILQALGEIHQQGLALKVVIYTIDPPSPTYQKGEFRGCTYDIHTPCVGVMPACR